MPLPAAFPFRLGPVSGLTSFDAPPSQVSPVACWRALTRIPLRVQRRLKPDFPVSPLLPGRHQGYLKQAKLYLNTGWSWFDVFV